MLKAIRYAAYRLAWWAAPKRMEKRLRVRLRLPDSAFVEPPVREWVTVTDATGAKKRMLLVQTRARIHQSFSPPPSQTP